VRLTGPKFSVCFNGGYGLKAIFLWIISGEEALYGMKGA